jgi:hypothetical protein
MKWYVLHFINNLHMPVRQKAVLWIRFGPGGSLQNWIPGSGTLLFIKDSKKLHKKSSTMATKCLVGWIRK